MNTFLKLTSLWILGNILLTVVMFVSGFDFTFPAVGGHNEGYYVFYGMMESFISLMYLLLVMDDVLKTTKRD